MRWFYLINGVFLLIAIPLEGYFLFPIYPWIEKFANNNKILILSQSVSESFKGLTYYNGQIYFWNQNVGNFTTLSFYRVPSPNFIWECNNGFANIAINLGFLNINFKRFGCLVYAKEINGNIRLYKNEIYGKINIKGLKITNIPLGNIDKINIVFNGKTFEAFAQIGNNFVKGMGKVKFNLLNLQNARIEAKFKSNGFSFALNGFLFNPQVVWQ